MRVNILILGLLISVLSYSQTEPDLIEIASGVDRPTAILHAGDGSGRLFICEQKGTVRILSNSLDGHLLRKPFLDIQNKVVDGGEKGLKGMAFHPKFPYAPYVYVSYITRRSGQLYSRIERYTVIGDPNVAIAGSGRTILEFQQPRANNNGGDIQFGLDGMLYASVGDGGGISDPNNTAQDGRNFLGSILRIDINGDDFPQEIDRNYSIPDDNPWVSDPSYKNELWSIGLRNPRSIVIDPNNGDRLITDQGQEVWEELNVQDAASNGGENYGWSCQEGSTKVAYQSCQGLPITEAAFSYDHYEGCGIVGGAIYRGSVFPDWEGKYFASDMCSRQFWIVETENGFISEKFDMSQYPPIGAFGASESGEIYVASTRTKEDKIYRLIDRKVCPGRYLERVMDQISDLSSNVSTSNSNSLLGSSGNQMKDKRFLQPMMELQAEQNKEALMQACIDELMVQK